MNIFPLVFTVLFHSSSPLRLLCVSPDVSPWTPPPHTHVRNVASKLKHRVFTFKISQTV